MEFDLACLFIGDAAVAAAVEDGFTEDDVTDDYWVRNENPTLRTVTVSAGSEFFCATFDAEVERCSRGDVGVTFSDVWLRVVDGQVDRVVEQFFP